MPHGHRKSTVEFNFDGLTDSVTNLVGAMILLVLLLLGMTRSAVQETAAAPANRGSGATGPEAASKLLEDLVYLRAQVETLNDQLDSLSHQTAEFRSKVENILRDRATSNK